MAEAIGMSSVEDYLYIIKARFDEMGVLEKKIDATPGKKLEDSGEWIGVNMRFRLCLFLVLRP